MKKIKTTYLAVVMLMLLPALALTACSDDDDTVHVKFDQSTVAGSWKRGEDGQRGAHNR